MFCALSGEPPQHPVLSRVSGQIFEKRLLESYLQSNAKDPTNGESMSMDDVLEVKTSPSIHPRPPSASSIPSLLSTFQNEWDALALESYSVKQQLYQMKQELSTALYQYDAACRVIARITKERDEAREALASVSEHIGRKQDSSIAGVPSRVVELVSDLGASLSAERKKRKVPADWTSAEQLRQMSQSRMTDKASSVVSVNSLGSMAMASGSNAQPAQWVDVVEGRVLSADESFVAGVWVDERVVAVTLQGDLAILTSSGNKEKTIQPSKPVVGTAALKGSNLVASITAEHTWFLHDIASGEELFASFSDLPAGVRLGTCAFHPDGGLLALGASDGNVYFYSLISSSLEAILGPAQGPINSLAFSENGYWLAVSAGNEASVKIWHLGKQTVVKELDAEQQIQALAWDHSGQFLAMGGALGIKIMQYIKSSKSWDSIFSAKDVTVQGLAWTGSKASGLLATGPAGLVYYST